MTMAGCNNSYSLGQGALPQVGMAVYETSPSDPGVIVEILGPGPKHTRYYQQQSPYFKVKVRWLNGVRVAVRSSADLHDLECGSKCCFARLIHTLD